PLPPNKVSCAETHHWDTTRCACVPNSCPVGQHLSGIECVPNDPNSCDVNGDGIPNGSDPDIDGDGKLNNDDDDTDGDGTIDERDDSPMGPPACIGGVDLCSTDIDGDGEPNASDPDVDDDGLPNDVDDDIDDDGRLNEVDTSPSGPTECGTGTGGGGTGGGGTGGGGGMENCGSDKHWDGKGCIPNGDDPHACASGYHWDGTQCIANGDDPQRCAPDYHWDGTKCIADGEDPHHCAEGYEWSEEAGKCVAKPTPTPTPPCQPKEWSATWEDEAGVVRGEMGREPQEDGTTRETGYFVIPQNQSQEPYQPEVVKVAPGATIQLLLKDPTDLDHWVKRDAEGNVVDQGEEGDSFSYHWRCEAGTLVSKSGTGARWQAPDETGGAVIYCIIDDIGAVTGCDEGERDDGSVERRLEIQVVDGPQVEFRGLINDTIRACAGGLDDDVHTLSITAHATKDDAPVADTELTFSFRGNRGHDYEDGREPLTARLYDDTDTNKPWKETLTKKTNDDGDIVLRVKSSDVISQPTVEVKWKNQQGEEIQVGSAECDFAEAVSKRRFPHFSDPGGDTGWIFNFPELSGPGAWTPAKIYMKFKINPDLGDVNGNWKFVNSHQMLLQIDEVRLKEGTSITDPAQFAEYAVLTPAPPIDSSVTGVVALTKVTANDGAAQVWVKAGPKIGDVAEVVVGAIDKSQFDN
ncbi:MAG: hypothetical protein M3347_07185, partial [Armatimonadota bacterium]|nr:hypothetical protein [Armatimonadota bacterium]